MTVTATARVPAQTRRPVVPPCCTRHTLFCARDACCMRCRRLRCTYTPDTSTDLIAEHQAQLRDEWRRTAPRTPLWRRVLRRD